MMFQMSQTSTDQNGKLEFRFESDASASFLVLSCEAKVLEYQALMLEHNRIRHVLPVDVIVKEGKSCYYYNITSKISLSFLLGRRKLSRDEFLRLVLNIASTVQDSAGYLLTASNFVFDPEYIYINPETMEPMLVYIPAVLEGGSGSTLQKFITGLLMQHINVQGFGEGNLIQRILSEVNNDLFNTKNLILLLNNLLYEGFPDAGKPDGLTDAGESFPPQPEEDKIEDKHKESGTLAGKAGIPLTRAAVPAVLAQIAMGAAIFAGRDFLNHVSGNPTATYAAVIMIILAIELLLFKKLNMADLIRIEKGKKSKDMTVGNSSALPGFSSIDMRYSKDKNSMHSAHTAALRVREMIRRKNCEAVYDTIRSESFEGALGQIPEPELSKAKTGGGTAVMTSGKTELLGKNSNGVRMLKSTRKQSGDEDIHIDKDDFIIGRLEDHVDHVIRNSAVGKLHAQLLRRNGTTYIKDLNSVNGTFVNGSRIESNKEVELKANDRVLLANSEYLYIE